MGQLLVAAAVAALCLFSANIIYTEWRRWRGAGVRREGGGGALAA